jgi:hypothetical protein
MKLFNFRIGAHGFIFMGENSSAPGNAGLLDQVKQQTQIVLFNPNLFSPLCFLCVFLCLGLLERGF